VHRTAWYGRVAKTALLSARASDAPAALCQSFSRDLDRPSSSGVAVSFQWLRFEHAMTPTSFDDLFLAPMLP
jgi:hypothetical protein